MNHLDSRTKKRKKKPENLENLFNKYNNGIIPIDEYNSAQIPIDEYEYPSYVNIFNICIHFAFFKIIYFF
jgi:hypothetical protein